MATRLRLSEEMVKKRTFTPAKVSGTAEARATALSVPAAAIDRVAATQFSFILMESSYNVYNIYKIGESLL
jgi:hypothetical protein